MSSITNLYRPGHRCVPVVPDRQLITPTILPTHTVSISTPSTTSHINNEMLVDATEIIPNLYLGDHSAGCNLKFITDKKIKLIINCAFDCSIPSFIMTNGLGICYIHHSITDHADTPIAHLFESCAKQIHESLLRNEGVLVHCAMGRSRSATIVLAYLIQYGSNLDRNLTTTMTQEEAFDFVRKKRKIDPNLGFVFALITFGEKITGKTTD